MNLAQNATNDQGSGGSEQSSISGDIETTVNTPVTPQSESASNVTAASETNPNTVDSLPDWAQDLIRDLRSENASRRVAARESDQKLGEYLNAIQGLLTNISQPSNNAEASESVPQAGVTESKPPAADEFVKTVMGQLDALSYDNAVMRVVSETGLNREVIETLQGRTYEGLLEQANKIRNYLTTNSSPSEETPESKPQNKPPKTPSAPTNATETDATKLGRYFGSGVAASSPVFGRVKPTFFDE